MTQEELKDRFAELLKVNPINSEIEQLYYKAVQSGAINITDEPSTDYRLPKIILYTALCSIADKWSPTQELNRQEAENLKHFL